TITLGDQDSDERLRRARSYWWIGELQKAEEDYSRAIELSPRNWQAWHSRAKLYARQHKPEKASSDLARAMEIVIDSGAQNDPGAQNEIAWSLATDPDPSWRNSAIAVQLAEKATAARPADGNIW